MPTGPGSPKQGGSEVALYDRIGRGYDDTRRADPGIAARLRALLAPAPEGRYLDVGCGTGSYTCAVAEGGGRFVGVDASAVMLRRARARAPAMAWRLASADVLPFPDACFDGALCTLAAHHFGDREAAFREVRRVLRGGPFVLFTCDSVRSQRYWLRAYFPEMFERMRAREPTEAQIVGALETAGFEVVEREPWEIPANLEDHFLYSGKHRPELYFDPAIRAGSSAFANLSTPEEVAAGLERLRADLESGRFADVAAAHPTIDGDYLFLKAV